MFLDIDAQTFTELKFLKKIQYFQILFLIDHLDFDNIFEIMPAVHA